MGAVAAILCGGTVADGDESGSVGHGLGDIQEVKGLLGGEERFGQD